MLTSGILLSCLNERYDCETLARIFRQLLLRILTFVVSKFIIYLIYFHYRRDCYGQ